jgi:hypothetical protein
LINLIIDERRLEKEDTIIPQKNRKTAELLVSWIYLNPLDLDFVA